MQNTNTTLVNPFYASRRTPQAKINALLPAVPRNMSPVPHLTSLYHFAEAGPYGDRSYPGNCGGNLIKDLLRFFQPESVFDPMAGSGTCRDVCQELEIPCQSFDLKQGFDACDPDYYRGIEPAEFIWAHPPYWRQKIYSNEPNDLSQTATLEEFSSRYQQFLQNCSTTLKSNGHLAVLMGDYFDQNAGYVPLTYLTKQFAFEVGLKQTCTDIIRFSHNATSSRKVYRSSFIPGLHDICMIFTKQ